MEGLPWERVGTPHWVVAVQAQFMGAPLWVMSLRRPLQVVRGGTRAGTGKLFL